MAPNANYWNPAAVPGHPASVVISIVSAADEPAMLASGQVDQALGMAATDIAKLKTNPALALFSAPAYAYSELFFNTQRAPLDDKSVRQALADAIDTNAIVARLSQLQGVPFYPTHGPVPPGLYPSSPDVPGNHHDVAMATQLLTDAGHTGGGFKVRLTYGDYDGLAALYVPLVVADLAQVGVTVDAQKLPPADLYNQVSSTDPAKRQDIYAGGRQPFRLDGAAELLSLYHSSDKVGANFSYYNSPAYDKLIDSGAAQEATNPDAALAQFVAAQKLLVDDAPMLLVFASGANFAVPTYVKGFAYNPNYFYFVDFSAISYVK